MITLKEGQSVDFTIVALDTKGRPAPVDGTPTIVNSNSGAADLFINPDGFSGKITHLDGGAVQITATLDADLGEGFKPITAIGDINCLPLEAVTAAITFGTPTP